MTVVFPLVLLIFMGMLFVGCDPGGNVSFSNKTTKPLFLRIDDGELSKLPAGEERGFGFFFGDARPVHVVITDESGCVVLTRDTTFGDLYKQGLTINDSDLPPSNGRVGCSVPTVAPTPG